MRRVGKIIAGAIITTMCIATLFNAKSVSASSVINENSNDGATVGEYLEFKSIDDETGLPTTGYPVYKNRQKSGIIYELSEVYVGMNLIHRATATGDSTISKQFEKYLTESWAKASQYTWSKATTTNWTYGGNITKDIHEGVRATLNLSRSRTTSYNIGVTIPADSSRFSKLGYASDFFKQDYKYELFVEGTVTQTETGYIKTPTQDSYLIVYYQ